MPSGLVWVVDDGWWVMHSLVGGFDVEFGGILNFQCRQISGSVFESGEWMMVIGLLRAVRR